MQTPICDFVRHYAAQEQLRLHMPGHKGLPLLGPEALRAEDLFYLADLGFTKLSMEPVVCAPDDPCALTEEDLPKLFEQYEILAGAMIRR